MPFEQPIHKTVPIKIIVDVDEGIADLVNLLNTIPNIRTHASCEGKKGKYAPYVTISWTSDEALSYLRNNFDLEEWSTKDLAFNNFGCIYIL